MSLLTNRQPKEAYTEIIKHKEHLHQIRMNEVISNDIETLTPEMFYSAFQYLTKKHGQKYKYLSHGGMSLHNALYNLFYNVWESEHIPKVWHSSKLVQLPKSRSNYGELSS